MGLLSFIYMFPLHVGEPRKNKKPLTFHWILVVKKPTNQPRFWSLNLRWLGSLVWTSKGPIYPSQKLQGRRLVRSWRRSQSPPANGVISHKHPGKMGEKTGKTQHVYILYIYIFLYINIQEKWRKMRKHRRKIWMSHGVLGLKWGKNRKINWFISILTPRL